jgi:uncharacterized protein DUF4124
MRGLAIASLILGIIGFLSSFWLGLGILPSISAVGLGIFPSVIKGNRAMAIIGLVLGLLGIFISVAIISRPEPYLRTMPRLPEKKEHIQNQTAKETTKEEQKVQTKTDIKLGGGVRIGELLITFNSARITKAYAEDKHYTTIPKPGYKFVVIKVTGENVGNKRDVVLSGGKIEVDKGYIYGCKYGNLYFNLLPKEKGSSKLVFEILESTNPVKLQTVIEGQRYTVDLKGVSSIEETTGSAETEPSLPKSGPVQKHTGNSPFKSSTLSSKTSEQSSTPSSNTRSRIYKWVDKNGVVHLTNNIDSIPSEYRDKLINGR